MKFYGLLFIFLLIQLNSICAQNIIHGKIDSSMIKNIRLEISSNKSNYRIGDEIFINYKFTNISNTDQKIMIRDYWKFPMGMGTLIINSSDSNICKYSSKHILASKIYTEKQLRNYYKKIKPGCSIKGKVKLQDIPVFKDYVKDNLIPVNKYKVCLSYFWLISNTIAIEVEK